MFGLIYFINSGSLLVGIFMSLIFEFGTPKTELLGVKIIVKVLGFLIINYLRNEGGLG